MEEFIVINTNGDLHIQNIHIKKCYRYNSKTLLIVTDNMNLYKELYKFNDDLLIVSVSKNDSNKLMTWANEILRSDKNGGKK